MMGDGSPLSTTSEARRASCYPFETNEICPKHRGGGVDGVRFTYLSRGAPSDRKVRQGAANPRVI